MSSGHRNLRTLPFLLPTSRGFLERNSIAIRRQFKKKANISSISVSLIIETIIRENKKILIKSNFFIAREKNKLNYHYEKWEPLIPLIS